MKRLLLAIALTLCFSAALCAQATFRVLPGVTTGLILEPRQDQDAPPAERGEITKSRRLEHVIWYPSECRLEWVVSQGSRDADGKYVRDGALLLYRIDMDRAQMTFKDETRGFDPEEARQVHSLMDVLSKYAIVSTAWWDEGKGEPVGRKERARACPAGADCNLVVLPAGSLPSSDFIILPAVR